MRVSNKIAVITGAASGFGEGMATRFAAERPTGFCSILQLFAIIRGYSRLY